MDGYKAKLARADQHINAFNLATNEWGNTDPLSTRRESNADGSEHIFYLQLSPEPDIYGWATILGDALHNLRGALDHIVYALAVAQTGKDPPDDQAKLAFPICSEPKFFAQSGWRIRSLDQPAQAAIERLQPYKRLKPGGSFMPLWWLSQLHDVDKHRFPHLTPIASALKRGAVGARTGTYQAFWNTGRLVDGAPILRLLLSEPDPNVYVDFEATAAVVVNVKNVGPYSVYWVTRHIRREVGIACRYLSLFFP
jgi:hypothetical protein